MNPEFVPGQKIRLHHDCTVFDYVLKRGLSGEVFAIDDSFGEPIFKVKFADGRALPMRARELEDDRRPVIDTASP
jgi:hypothetical protein